MVENPNLYEKGLSICHNYGKSHIAESGRLLGTFSVELGQDSSAMFVEQFGIFTKRDISYLRHVFKKDLNKF